MQDDNDGEFRDIPTEKKLHDEANKNPRGWVYDIDFEYKSSDFVPPEAIRGAWEVSENGLLTGKFKPNVDYCPIEEVEHDLPQFYHDIAENYKGIWISEIDRDSEKLFPKITPEMIVGYWFVGENGKIQDKFRPNSKYKKSR